jgi:hypothetical protein
MGCNQTRLERGLPLTAQPQAAPDPSASDRAGVEALTTTVQYETVRHIDASLQLSQMARPPHFGPEALLESVASGAIAPLRGRWLIELEGRGDRLKRRQDLPVEAFFGIQELRKLVEALGDDYGHLFVALSYRWLSKDHPDPDGFHLGIVAEVARLYLPGPGMRSHSPLTKAFQRNALGDADFALFCALSSTCICLAVSGLRMGMLAQGTLLPSTRSRACPTKTPSSSKA